MQVFRACNLTNLVSGAVFKRRTNAVLVTVTDGKEASLISPTSPQSSVTSSEPVLTTSVGALAGDALPYSVGVDSVHTFACCFCEKAFSKTSYLSKHRQVGTSLMSCRLTLGLRL